MTIGNETFKLPAPFLVIATQNPIEQSGTFELPEAQLDRFMLCHRLDYPDGRGGEGDPQAQRRAGHPPRGPGRGARTEFDVIEGGPVATTEDLVRAMEAVHEVHVSETFTDHVVELVKRTRTHPAIELGGSPRAGIALVKGSRARALIHGRHYVIPEDLFALAEDVILHRMRLTYEALAEGRTAPACSGRSSGPSAPDARTAWRRPTAGRVIGRPASEPILASDIEVSRGTEGPCTAVRSLEVPEAIRRRGAAELLEPANTQASYPRRGERI